MELNDIERRFRFRTSRPVAELRAGRTEWYRIENKTDSADVYLFDEIGYWGTTAQQFVDEIKAIKAPTINLHINSPGGEVFDGIAIHSVVRNHPATVNVYVDGLAASIASVIAMAGDTITMGAHSQMMIHDGLGICIGNEADMVEFAGLLGKCSDTIAGVYAERTGSMSARNKARWRAAMKAETWYTAQEAVDAGLADTVDKSKPGSDPENSFDLSIFAYAGRENAPAPDVEPTEEPDETDPEGNPTDQVDPAENPPPTSFSFDPDVFRAAFKEATHAR